MARTKFTRKLHERVSSRYSSDVTDAEWSIIGPMLPPGPNRIGWPREVELRGVWDAIQYIASAGSEHAPL